LLSIEKMNFKSIISLVAFMVASGVELLTISEPINGATYGLNEPINVLISNDEEVGEAFVNAAVTFASPCGSIVSTLPVGTVQSIYLPCNVVGSTTVSARSGSTQASPVQIVISPVYNVDPATLGATVAPYGAPCGNPCYQRNSCRRSLRSSCRRRVRGCGYYGEQAEDVQEFQDEALQAEQDGIALAELYAQGGLVEESI
jgi:hypothetical protein